MTENSTLEKVTVPKKVVKVRVKVFDDFVVIVILAVLLVWFGGGFSSEEEKTRNWKIVEMCMAQGGIPITRLSNSNRLANCQFKP